MQYNAKIWVYRGISRRRRRREKFLGLSTRYFGPFFLRVGGTPTFGPRVGGGGTPKIAVERKMEQGFHSGGPQGSVDIRI